MPRPVAAAGAGQAAAVAMAQEDAGSVDGPARGQMQPGLAGHAGGAQLPAEGDRAAAVVVGVDLLEQDGGTGGLRDRGRQDRGPVCGGAGIVLPMRPAGRQEAARQLPVVQAVGERHVPRLETLPLPGIARRPDGRGQQERRQHVLAVDRDREPVHHRIGHPDRRPGRDRQFQAVPGAHRHMPDSGGRGQPDPRRGRVRAQLRHILAGRLDVHGGHRHPGRVQQPGRHLLQDTGHHGVPGRPRQQRQQQLGIDSPQPQRHRPLTAILGKHRVGEHDELLAVHGTAGRHPTGPGISKHDTDNRHDDPPEDSKTATRPTLISVRRPRHGLPAAGRSGNRQHPSPSTGRDGPDR